MEIVFFSGLTVSLALFLWQFTYCLSGFNRTLGGITATMMQNAVTYDEANTNVSSSIISEKPYFSTYIVKSIVTQYIDETLPGAVLGGDYSLSFFFSDYQKIVNRNPRFPMEVTILLDYESPAYSASRSKTFIITKGAAYES